MRKDKELGALRVMEALSAVDEELLERCEEPGAATAGGDKKAPIYRFVQRCAKACAACLCLVVLGAVYFGMRQMDKNFSRSNEAKSDGADNYSGQMAGEAENAAPMDMAGDTGAEAPVEEATEGFSFSGGASAEGEPEWLDVEHLAALPDATLEQETTAAEEGSEKAEAVKENDRVQSADKSSDSVGAAMQSTPTREELGEKVAVPERYSPVEMEAGNGGRDSLLYEWSDGEHSLWLRITQTELKVDMLIDAEPPVYTVQEEWRELIPDAGVDGYVQFALLYENGMLAEYRGVLEREEIIRLMESLVW